MKLLRLSSILICITLIFSACTIPVAPTQTTSTTSTEAVPSPSQAAVPPAATAPVASPEMASTAELPSVQITPSEFFKVIVPLGQFSFLSPTDAKVTVAGSNASATWDSLNLLVGVAYRAHTVDAIDPLAAVDLGILNEIGIDPGQVQVSQGDEISVSGYPTHITNLSIEIDQAPLKGEALSIILTDHSYLFVFGIQMMVKPTNDWEKDGKMRFQQIARSINFDPNADSSLYVRCDMAKDIDYGYKQEKPIKVGGGELLGSTQMEIFINNLMDAKTSSVLAIAPLDPIQIGSQILYPWEFTSNNETKTIYIDTTNFEDPKTPIGITCRGTLPSIELVKP
ncbi:MAG TPA: hypothetical protein VLR89_02295 [Anaerolineaceae bacterium]|nr:hypothetical protein [Anaerolineaceae bacterium]